MEKLESELAYNKMMINSNYGFNVNTNASMLVKAYQIRIRLKRRISIIKMRKNKIKKIFNL